jgi:hypothetical protein
MRRVRKNRSSVVLYMSRPEAHETPQRRAAVVVERNSLSEADRRRQWRWGCVCRRRKIEKQRWIRKSLSLEKKNFFGGVYRQRWLRQRRGLKMSLIRVAAGDRSRQSDGAPSRRRRRGSQRRRNGMKDGPRIGIPHKEVEAEICRYEARPLAVANGDIVEDLPQEVEAARAARWPGETANSLFLS